MTIEAIFGGKCLCCSFTSLIIFGVGLFAEVIINASWYSKYYPWMGAASGPVRYVYLCTIICTIFSILTLLLLGLMLICFFVIKSCSRNVCACITLCIFIVLCTIVSIVTAFGAGLYGMAGIYAEDKLYGKCYDHIFDQICTNVLDDVLSESSLFDSSKLSNYVSWIIDKLYSVVVFGDKKIPKDEYKKNNQKRWVLEILGASGLDAQHEALMLQITGFIALYGRGNLNNSMCATLYVPTILFLVVEMIGFIWFLFSTCCGCCCGRKTEDYNTNTSGANTNININIQSSSLL